MYQFNLRLGIHYNTHNKEKVKYETQIKFSNCTEYYISG